MKKLLQRIRSFFLPPEGTSIWLRLAPYLFLGILTIFALLGSAYAWVRIREATKAKSS